MLTISIGAVLVWLLFTAVAGFLFYQVFKKDPDYLSDDDSSTENDIFYGAYLDVDPQFLTDNNIKQASSIQVSLPMPTTPEGHVRAEIDHLSFINIPYSKILGYYDEEKSTRTYRENKKAEYTMSYSSPIAPPSSNTNNGLAALGLFDGLLSSEPDAYTKNDSDSSSQQSFGNGGEFAGGGASGSWEDDTPSNDYSTISTSCEGYSSSSDSSSYSNDSSYGDSGSSSYDSGSSDTSSSSSDSW